MVVKRFEVYLINLDPTVGSEIKKARPCLVISPDEMNRHNQTEEDWNAIQETLFLLSIPGMRESIKEGMAEPLSESSKDLDW